MPFGKVLTFLWEKVIKTMPVKTVILILTVGVGSSAATMYAGYEFYYKDKIEAASGSSVEDLKKLQEDFTNAKTEYDAKQEEYGKKVKQFDEDIEEIKKNGAVILDRVSLLTDLVKELIKR